VVSFFNFFVTKRQINISIFLYFFFVFLSTENLLFALDTSDLKGFIGKDIACDPKINCSVELDDIRGLVKKVTTDNEVIYFDKSYRVVKIESIMFGTLLSVTEYSYKWGKMYPSACLTIDRKGNRYKTEYTRDRYNNVIAVNGKIRDIRKDGDFYVYFFKSKSLDTGDVYKYYKDGLVVKEIVSGGFNMLSSSNCRTNETLYSYEYYENGRISKIVEKHFNENEFERQFVSFFDENGSKIGMWSSQYQNPDPRTIIQWTDHVFDEFGNWTSRKRCEVEGTWGNFKSCTLEERSIEYY